MGMFDSIRFSHGNTVEFPAEMTPNLQKEDWQTKGLYNSLYNLVFENNLLWYQERGGSLHLLPLTGSFEIHTWIPDESKFYEYEVLVENGELRSIGPRTDAFFRGLPHVTAMDRDADLDFQGWNNTMEMLKKIDEDRSAFHKFQLRVRSAKREWAQALEFFVRGFKRLLGLKFW